MVTNDFPPRLGGIQSFVHQLVVRQPPESIAVFTSGWPTAEQFDRAQAFPVMRYRYGLLLPTPDVIHRVRRLIDTGGFDTIVFGATAPLAAMAGSLRRAGVSRIIGLTHGHESAWASTPGTRRLIAYAGDHADRLTYLGDYTRARLTQAMSPAAANALRRLVPGVDSRRFTPERTPGSRAVRARFGLGAANVILCVSRLMPRKGQDLLIKALPLIRQELPDTKLLLVGEGSYGRSLRRLAVNVGEAANVIFAQARTDELPDFYRCANVFAMPCRTRNRGWDVEGLGIVYLEAAASGLPVVAGASGGAPDSVVDDVTGRVVDGRSRHATAHALIDILGDPERAATMGAAGRQWAGRWNWDDSSSRFAAMLAGQDPDSLDAQRSQLSGL